MKRCTACLTVKPLAEFSWRDKAKGTKQSSCKECKRELDRNRYQTGAISARLRENAKKHIEINKDYVWSVLIESQCIDCGEDDPVVLEFDHVRGDKIMQVSTMVNDAFSLTKIKEEIAKCEVVCANCHKRRTSKRANHWRHVRMAELAMHSVEA